MTHHWSEHPDLELVAAVTGLGEVLEPDELVAADADALPDHGTDLRGDRDKDPQAPHPWRSS